MEFLTPYSNTLPLIGGTRSNTLSRFLAYREVMKKDVFETPEEFSGKKLTIQFFKSVRVTSELEGRTGGFKGGSDN